MHRRRKKCISIIDSCFPPHFQDHTTVMNQMLKDDLCEKLTCNGSNVAAIPDSRRYKDTIKVLQMVVLACVLLFVFVVAVIACLSHEDERTARRRKSIQQGLADQSYRYQRRLQLYMQRRMKASKFH